MLTPRQNFLETIHGGHPDRFVNQFDFMENIIVALGDSGSFDTASAHFLSLDSASRRGALEEFKGWFA